MEQELGVPWEDVFETIDPQPLAAGTIAQVHRATLADHTRAVVKVQRPTRRSRSNRTWRCSRFSPRRWLIVPASSRS